MRKIVTIAARDLKSGLRDGMILYTMLFPVIAAVILRFFLPAVGEAGIRFAVPAEADPAFVLHLEEYGMVETVRNREELETRIRQTDDIVGLVQSEEGFRIILEGNEAEGIQRLTEGILAAYAHTGDTLPAKVVFDEMGWELSPLILYGASALIVILTYINGIFIALCVVEDKQYLTLHAISVTPVTMMQYVIGKGVLGFAVPLVQSFLILLILNMLHVQLLMVAAIVIFSSFIGVILGFLNGAINKDSLAAASSMKASMFPLLLGMLGSMFLQPRWHVLLYWNPFYWSYSTLEKIIREVATWTDILISGGAILAITAVVFLLIRKKIMKALA